MKPRPYGAVRITCLTLAPTGLIHSLYLAACFYDISGLELTSPASLGFAVDLHFAALYQMFCLAS